MEHNSDESSEQSCDDEGPVSVDQHTESPNDTLDQTGHLSPVDDHRDQLPPNGDFDDDLSPPDEEEEPSEGHPSPPDEDLDFLDVDEAMCRHALILYLKGQTYQEIADYFDRSERTIRRWVKKAKERGLLRVDNLKPWQQLSEILLMIDQHRAELIDLKGRAQDAGDEALVLRCLRELMAMEEKRLRILDKVGLFNNYSAYRSPFDRAIDETSRINFECRTKVEGENEEEG